MAAAAPPGHELCPHCHKPFKRLRGHLPHCKAAPSPASVSTPGQRPRSRPGPGVGPGPGLSAAPSSGSPGAGPAVGTRAGSKLPVGAAGKSNRQPPSPSVKKGLPGAAPHEEEAAAAWKGKAAAGEQGEGSSLGLRRQPDGCCAERKVDPTVEDVAKSLDLLPEEVKDISEQLNNGVKIVIEKHRARVMREKSGSRSRGASAGSHSTHGSPGGGLDAGGITDRADAAQPGPQEGIAKRETTNTKTRGLGAAGSASASSKGQKGSSIKATKKAKLGEPSEADCRRNPRDLVQQEAADKTVTEEKQMYLEVGVEYKAPLSALHTKNLHLSAEEGFRGHKEGASKNYLTSRQKLQESKKQMVSVSEPILNARRDTELALAQFFLHTSKSQPICLSQASGRSMLAGAVGLEWFPDLYPSYHGLSIFPGKPSQGDKGITTEPPRGSFSEGQQGPLSARCLMDVRLGELPAWLATCDLSPQGLLGGVQKAWSSYYAKYINVKRGGPAGISMLLAGYCLLSYGWNYQHIKHHRWRKYH